MKGDIQKQGYSEYVEDNLPGIVQAFPEGVVKELIDQIEYGGKVAVEELFMQHGYKLEKMKVKATSNGKAYILDDGSIILSADGAAYVKSCTLRIPTDEGEE